MHDLDIDIHQLGPDTASGAAERLGFALPWVAHGLHDEWTVSVDRAAGCGLEPGAFEVVTDDDWRAFEAAVRRAIQTRSHAHQTR